MTYQEFTRLLIAEDDMTAYIKAIIKRPELDLQRVQFQFYEPNNDHDINHWYLVRNNMFADLKPKLDKYEITHFKWKGKLFIGLVHDIKNNQKLRDLYDSYLLG